ncbi:MAG: phage-shock protein [Desulfobacterales bacterium]
MKEVIIVAIVLGSIVLALAIIPGAILLAIKFIRGGQSAGDQAEEAKMIQEIYKGLSRMAERVESLETILLDQEKRKRTKERKPNHE